MDRYFSKKRLPDLGTRINYKRLCNSGKLFKKGMAMKKIIIIIISVLSTICIFSTTSYAYSDVESHWANKEIAILSAKEIIGGYPDGTFRPDKSITRAEFTTLLLGAIHQQKEALSLQSLESTFQDVPFHHWAKGQIELAYELGLVNGYEDNTFRPDNSITRAEIAAVLVRSMKVTSETSGNLPFADYKKIPDWAKSAVKAAYNEGLVKGDSLGYFHPLEKATRAEAAVLITRLLERSSDKYDYLGKLKGIDMEGKRLRIEIYGKDIIFNFDKLNAVYSENKKISLPFLKKQLPLDVYFILNDKGKITYLEVARRDNGNSQLEIISDFESSNFFDTSSSSLNNEEAIFTRNFENADKRIEKNANEDAAESLSITLKEINADKFKQAVEVFGRKQLIAIIDTGVDPGHPDLQKGPGGEKKIVRWVDFTSEGLVKTSNTIRKRNYLTLGEETFKIGDIPTATGYYKYGFLKESRFLRDLNFNGDITDNYLVLLTAIDSKNYNTVYVDTDGDGNLTDEDAVEIYNESYQIINFGSGNNGRIYNFVISNIAEDGSSVQFSTDFNGHGTHVAGIIGANGGIKGIAPAAEIMVVKALDANGEAEWKNIHDAIRYAAENGADVINLSLGYYDDKTAGNNSLTDLISRLTMEYGVVFTVATGNKGPGIASVATPGNALDAISVGAFISPDMWKHDYGWNVENDSLWYFSSLGPRKDGLSIPTIVAPGSVVSTTALWTGEKYCLAEGTSVATPYVAGGVALLKESMEKIGREVTPQEIKRAIVMGAKNLPGFQPFEVGAGVLNLLEAWHQLLVVSDLPRFRIDTYDMYFGTGHGIYAREYIPGKMFFEVVNEGNAEQLVMWRTINDMAIPSIDKTRIAPGNKRTIAIEYNIPEEPGIYSTFLIGDVPDSYGNDVLGLSTVIVPYVFSAENDYTVKITDTIPAAQIKRYFFKVPPDTEEFKVKMKVIEEGIKDFKGRARFHLINPDGQEIIISDYAGVAPEGAFKKGEVQTVIKNPEKGTWEVVLYSSASLSDYNLEQSDLELSCSIKKEKKEKNPKRPFSWLIGYVPTGENESILKSVTLHIHDENSKRPVDGVIKINGRYYQIKNGIVTFKIKQGEEIIIGR